MSNLYFFLKPLKTKELFSFITSQRHSDDCRRCILGSWREFLICFHCQFKVLVFKALKVSVPSYKKCLHLHLQITEISVFLRDSADHRGQKEAAGDKTCTIKVAVSFQRKSDKCSLDHF